MAIQVSFLGLGIDEMTPAEAVATIRARWQARAKSRVFFVNAHCFNVASADAAYREALSMAEFVLVDGSGMLLASRLLGLPIQNNLNGTDLVPALCETAAAEGRSIFLLGARHGVAQTAAERLADRYPGLRIAGVQHGYFAPEDSAQIIEQINAAKPDILLVAMGVPLQEQWLTDHFAELDVPVCLAVGALLDFLSHSVRRAPLIFRKLGIEWLYRLYLEPRRLWRRYVVGNVTFLSHVLLNLVWSEATLPVTREQRGAFPLRSGASVAVAAHRASAVDLLELAESGAVELEHTSAAGVVAHAPELAPAIAEPVMAHAAIAPVLQAH